MDIESTSDYQLEKNTEQDSAMNFEFLRARGIELIQQYAGGTWTDYNLHDPGVTMLEYLCYAITDLAYRTSFSIEDILTEKDGTIDLEKNLFYLKNQVLTTNPVLVNDFRKLVIDQLPEVYNVWIEPVTSAGSADYIKGLYEVFIQPTNDELQESFEYRNADEQEQFRNNIAARVSKVLNEARNIGYDYERFTVLEPCDVRVEAEVVVDRHRMHEELLAEVYDVLIEALNPPINFYTETALREKGMSTEEIYQGPALSHGFIIDEEMTEKVSIVDPSDLAKAVLGIEGVKYLRKLVVTIDGEPYEHKPFYVEAGKFPRFLFNLDQPTIRLYSDSYEVPVKQTIFSSLLHKKLDANKRKYIKGYHDPIVSVYNGEYRNVSNYQSFQQLFPPVYRINIDEIETERMARSEQHTAHRINQAKAKQLKGYLMLFEQVLANYLTQLGNIGEILSPNLELGGRHHTYFAQPLYSVPGAANILSDFMRTGINPTYADWDRFKEDPANGYVQMLEQSVESGETFRERKKRLLDHMLSRFNINLLKYPLQVYERLYKPYGEFDHHIELKWKADILKNIVSLTAYRNQATRFTTDDDPSEGGFERLMRTLLYLDVAGKKRIGETFARLTSGSQVSIQKNNTAPSAAPVMYELNWDGQRLDMQIDEAEMNHLLHSNEEDSGDTSAQAAQADEAIRVPQRSVSFLKDGINSSNYRIGPEINGKGFIVLYRAPKDRHWTRVGKYETRDKASAALLGFMKALKKISIETEGFYLVEHVLLRPSLRSSSFGFVFHDEKGEVLFRHNQWYTFEARKQVLASIIGLAMSDDPPVEELTSLLQNTCTMVKRQDILTSPDADPFIRKLIDNVRESQEAGTVLYPCFRNVVLRENGEEIEEEFFRFRMTVVFPSWPARFQEKAFRSFAENLFVENSPAHMKIHFKWLSVSDIRSFEEQYGPWTEMMANRDAIDSREQSENMITLLNKDLR